MQQKVARIVHLFKDSISNLFGNNFFSTGKLITAFVFFFSGFSSLPYQVVWQRVLTQEIGVDSISIAFIVTIFMIGLGFGAMFGGWTSVKIPRFLGSVYAILELAIGIFGIYSVHLLRWANSVNAVVNHGSSTMDFLTNLSVLAFPTFLMGMTTPIIVHFLRTSTKDFGKTIGIFYGVNVLGAAVGAFYSIYLIEIFNLSGLCKLSAGINIAIGLIFFIYTVFTNLSSSSSPEKRDASSEPDIKISLGDNLKIKTSVFIFGFVNLSFQMIIFRILTFYFSPYPTVFSCVLFSFLLLMAVGQSVTGAWIDKTERKTDVLFLLFTGAFISFLLILNIPFEFLDDFVMTGTISSMVTICAVFLIPAAFISGYLPAVSRLSINNINKAGSVFGSVLFWSTLGNILGAFFTALFLFEKIGTIWSSILIAWGCFAGVYLISKVNLIRRNGGTVTTNILKCSVALLIAFTIFAPKDYFFMPLGRDRNITKFAGTSRPINVIEGKTSVTAVYYNQPLRTRMEIRPYGAGAAAAYISEKNAYYGYYSLAVSQMLDPKFRPKRILQIGLGAGELPYVMKELPFVKKFVMIELCPEVLQAYETYSDPLIAATLKHPKVEFHVTDGRRYVQNALARGEKFDLIQLGPGGVGISGSSNIYSYEFFKKLIKLLTPDGMLSLEPYVGVDRIGFEFFEYGYTIEGSSWLFMRHKPLPSDRAPIIVDEPQFRWYQAKQWSEMHTPLDPLKVSPLNIKVNEYHKNDIKKHFPLIERDHLLMFEYSRIRSQKDDYVNPATKVYDLKTLNPRTLSYTVKINKHQ